MAYRLNSDEKVLLAKIEASYYMAPTLKRIDDFVSQTVKSSWVEAFNRIYNILLDAKDEVEEILERRRASGKIKDIGQARKSIAGNAFSNAVMYIFLQNKIGGNIKPDIFITNQTSQVKNFDKVATINIGGETQKPDCDLVVFNQKENGDMNKCMILSLKTSLRERAGQTYKWKLLLEIATTPNPIKDKYQISYNPEEMPLVCFATVNFYNEINQPQHRGMFKFFDKSFIAKPRHTKFVSPLSDLVDFVNEQL